MLTVCRRYLKRPEDAEEALLLGFAKVFQALPTFRQEGSFEGWIRRIMVNEALMELRRREPLHLSFEDFAQPGKPGRYPRHRRYPAASRGAAGPAPNPTPGYRAVFNLYAVEGYCTSKSRRCWTFRRAPASRNSARRGPCCNASWLRKPRLF
ncbi:MAG: sigma-70 family RNA polymerase sigma factor [Hymenobacter sp.]